MMWCGGSVTSIAHLTAAPCWRIVLALRQLGDEVGGVAQGTQVTAVGQGDGIVEAR